MPGLMRSAFEEGRERVFGAGFDRGFKLLLAIAVVGGGVVLALRHPQVDVPVVLVAIVSMAFFVAMPFLAVTVFCTAISLFAGWAGTREGNDPPMAAVLAACALTLVIVVSVVAGVAQIPLVGSQLRAMFA